MKTPVPYLIRQSVNIHHQKHYSVAGRFLSSCKNKSVLLNGMVFDGGSW